MLLGTPIQAVKRDATKPEQGVKNLSLIRMGEVFFPSGLDHCKPEAAPQVNILQVNIWQASFILSWYVNNR